MAARKTPPAEVGRPVKVVLAEAGGKGSTVEVDGHDITGLVRAVTVVGRAGDVTVVQLELAQVTVQGDVTGRVEVDASTRDFLLTLGWVAPEA